MVKSTTRSAGACRNSASWSLYTAFSSSVARIVTVRDSGFLIACLPVEAAQNQHLYPNRAKSRYPGAVRRKEDHKVLLKYQASRQREKGEGCRRNFPSYLMANTGMGEPIYNRGMCY
ncbi:hypothetical protein WG66_005077 [Moniliophthora roreri]|nr:hypothetical protein WG66_005077 [Moniliophthora roreri]